MVGTELTPMQSFTEKLQDKIRNDIAGMLPDDVIAQMTQKAVDGLFFEKKKTTVKDRWGDSKPIDLPTSQFEDMVVEAAKPIIDARVADVINAHTAQINETVQKAIDQGLMKLALKHLDTVITEVLLGSKDGYNFAFRFEQELRNKGMR